MVAPTLFLLVALSLFPNFIYANHLSLNRRFQHRKRALPAGWTSRGCYTDAAAGRTLLGAYSVDAGGNSVDACTAKCNAAGFFYAGVEFGKECFCGNTLSNNGVPAPASDCNFACPGNAGQKCGAGNRLNIYAAPGAPPAPPTAGSWQSIGCWSDSTTARSLGTQQTVAGGMTVEKCQAACGTGGFSLSGVEFATQCFCGNAFANNPTQKPDSDCNMACSGNGGEKCGGPSRLNVYRTAPQNNPQWKSLGCVSDVVNARTLSVTMPVQGGVTTESCQQACQAAGYPIAGTEFSTECYCDVQFRNTGVAEPLADCNMNCAGNAAEKCGGADRLNAYYNTAGAGATTVQTTNLPANWEYQYCLAEPNNGRVFPYQITWLNNNTVDACLNQCAKFGFPAAGLQYGQECWCGDPADVAANGGTHAPDGDCNMPCSGDPLHFCGAGFRNQYYKYNGDLFVWNTPHNTGLYEFFVPGLVVPLIATVGINNKITFLEKAGSGNPNSTGAYELDPSLVGKGPWENAWRTMHVKTDVFCSASLILPDKAGRQINIAGWSGDSLHGIRLFTPSGSPGQPSTTDWQENEATIQLQRPRWYASALVMANGSILVMGGEEFNSGPEQANLELLPRTPGGDTTVYLDFLDRTHPNNLYPFLFVLPSQNILVVYYNEARILNKKTFATITQLPNIPGAVNNFLGGRTYGFSGTAMLIPQQAPYTDPVEVLICGGSTPAKDGIDNCVRTHPEVPGEQWIIERMPSKRVLVCMANLPDGTFLIVNGAEHGAGGFANADTPNHGAVLYDPSQPTNHRFSKLNTTTISRMYHSEATLLPDGSVLISGSDPLDARFPEEYRLEKYLPPYLTSGLPAPQYTITQKDWNYGGTFAFTLTKGSSANLRVSLIAAASSTHGNGMGSRTIFPAFNCNGNACTVTAPPNAGVCPPGWFMMFVLDGPTPSQAQWVRIGGDPAKLGNWPPGNSFTRPGV